MSNKSEDGISEVCVSRPQRGAPKWPKELVRSKSVMMQFTDEEKQMLSDFAEKTGMKMQMVLRVAGRKFMSSGEYPPESLAIPELQQSGFQARPNRILLKMTETDRAELGRYVATHQIKMSGLYRYALRKYIEENT